MNVVLFDIDGTLISTRGGGKRSMQTSLLAHFGTVGPDDYRYDGKTDRQIARELMRAAGFTDDVIDERMDALLDDYLAGLRSELAAATEAPSVYPGVFALLDALEQRADVTVGLLTGNIEQGAHAKLGAANIDPDRFRFGAFGSDHERRDELPGIAHGRARALLQRELAGDALVIIGDTPSDVTCGRKVGARSIGVATGSYRVEALQEYQPTAVFADLSDTARVVDVIVRAS